MSRIGRFRDILAMFFKSQSNDFDVIAHARAPVGVDKLCKIFLKIVWTVVKKFEGFRSKTYNPEFGDL